MAIGSTPLDSIELETHHKSIAADNLRHTHGCVWGDGRVTEHVCKPPKKGDVGTRFGDTPLLWMNGDVVVRKSFQKRYGCRRLIDVFIADFGEEEGKRRHQEWRNAISVRGKVEIKNPHALYPPSVMKMRREHATGVSEDQVFIPGQGLVAATEDVRAERVAGLLGAAGLGEPTAEDRAAAKKAKA